MDMNYDTHIAGPQFFAFISGNAVGKHNLFMFFKHRFAPYRSVDVP